MIATTVSKFEEVNRVLQEHNPFSQPPYVQAKHVWEESFPDIDSLNSHASDAVFKALNEIRSGHYSTTSLLITAQNGTGKTHIISRIRHRLKKNGEALFVFANQFNDLNEVKHGFQKLLSISLWHKGALEVSQWQEIASKIANVALKKIKPKAKDLEPKELIAKFSTVGISKASGWIQKITDTFCQIQEVRDPEIVKAILWCLAEQQESHAVNWLGGEELAQYKANELRLPSQRKSFDTVLQTLNIITYFYELVICFDELDVDEFNETGLHKSQVIAGLVKELFESLGKGLILSTMMPGTWNERVKQLPGGVWNKMTAQGRPYELRYMDENSIIDLVEFSLQKFYQSKQIQPPHKLYPFEENQLREIGKEKPTVREVLRWCRENCKPKHEIVDDRDESVDLPELTPEPESITRLTEINEALTIELQEESQSYWADNQRLGKALYFSFGRLVGKTLEGVEIIEVTDGTKRRKRKEYDISFKIIGRENGSDICIGVSVLQDSGGRGLGAGFRRLLDEPNEFELTRGCLVRSKEKPLSLHFQKTYLEPLINVKGGEFVDLKLEEIQPLIAIHNVYRKREEYSFTEDQIFEFMENAEPSKLLGTHNLLIQEILSAPSHVVPEVKDEPEANQIENLHPEALIEPDGNSSFDSGVAEETDTADDTDLLDVDDDDDMLSSGSTGLTDLIEEDE